MQTLPHRGGNHRLRLPALNARYRVANKGSRQPKFTVGWREWIALPELGVPAIKAKVDTGARSSAIHAEQVELYEESGLSMVRFNLGPNPGWPDHNLTCKAPLHDRRPVKDSGGKVEERYFIKTHVLVGLHIWTVELSLTGRDTMKFRMLLGREAVRRRALVDPGHSFLTRTPPKKLVAGHRDKPDPC